MNVTAATGDVDYIGVLAGDDTQAAHLDLYLAGTHDDAAHLAAGVSYLWGLPQPIIDMFRSNGEAVWGDVEPLTRAPA